MNGTAVIENASLKASLAYANMLGWSVFPLHSIMNGQCTCNRSNCSTAGKHPIPYDGLMSATTNEATINEWFTKHPHANIGVATGKLSGFFALDVDPRHGGDHSLEELINNHGRLPNTIEAITGGQGRHILFKHHEGVGNKANILDGLDIRGDGGYIVVAPSNHESGGSYEWELSSRPVVNEVAESPQWLLDMIVKPKGQRVEAKPSSYWQDVMRGVSEGDRNNKATSLAGYLFKRYVNPYMVVEIMRLWNDAKVDPPLEDDELMRIVNSVAGKELARKKGG